MTINTILTLATHLNKLDTFTGPFRSLNDCAFKISEICILIAFAALLHGAANANQNPYVNMNKAATEIQAIKHEINLTDRQLRNFWKKVDKAGDDECWMWTGSKLGKYGGFGTSNGVIGAHRIAWIIANGQIPPGDGYHGTCVCHFCDERTCVNPSHLFLGSHIDNMMDMDTKGRRKSYFSTKNGGGLKLEQRVRGEMHGRSKLTASQVLEIRGRSGQSKLSIAAEFCVSRRQISNILNRKKWTHI